MTKRALVSLAAVLTMALAGACGAPESVALDAVAVQAPDTLPWDTSVPKAATPGVPEVPSTESATATVSSEPALAAGRASTPYPAVPMTGDFLMGADAVWPEYIPAEIPPLEGDIYLVIPGTERIRIQYSTVPEDRIEAYLEDLIDLGYKLDYLYYVEEGKPDTSAERMARGEYDAVDATMGVYALRIEYGANSATLDIDARAFSAALAEAIAVQWPAELVAVPAPERCALVRVVALQQGGYHILCQRADAGVDSDYEASLEASGFTEVSRLALPDGTAASVDMSDGTWQVTLFPSMVAYFTIDVTPAAPAAAAGVAWPPELAGVVPEPASGSVQSVMLLGDRGTMVQCAFPDMATLEAYFDALEAAGFTAMSRMDSNGRLVRVDYTRDTTEVSMMISQMSAPELNVIIQINQ